MEEWAISLDVAVPKLDLGSSQTNSTDKITSNGLSSGRAQVEAENQTPVSSGEGRESNLSCLLAVLSFDRAVMSLCFPPRVISVKKCCLLVCCINENTVNKGV